MRLDIRHVRVLVEIASAGSIRKAAGVLHVAQPALAAQLQRIENVLGGAVFTRARSGITPTELGRYVIGSGRDLLARFDRLLADTASASGPVVFGVMSVLDAGTGLRLLRTAMPGADIALHDVNSVPDALAMVRRGELDLVLFYEFPGSRLPLPDGVLRRVVTEVEPAFVGLPADHPHACLDALPLEALASERWIIGGDADGAGREARFRSLCGRSGFSPRIRHRVDTCESMFQLVRSGEGIALFSPMCVPPADVVLRPLAGEPHYKSTVLCWRVDSPVDLHVDEFHRLLVADYQGEIGLRAHYRDWWVANVGDVVESSSPRPVPCVI
ncbi:LysR family transcriptional regulator [Actinokineospora sp. HUAS TT18]|uniref:LysR family transcriptional regulator n=1 Tax=Actinokineospora sp. HUAS TT18 TaxID=3447451 RepID=UPI003F528D63